MCCEEVHEKQHDQLPINKQKKKNIINQKIACREVISNKRQCVCNLINRKSYFSKVIHFAHLKMKNQYLLQLMRVVLQ